MVMVNIVAFEGPSRPLVQTRHDFKIFPSYSWFNFQNPEGSYSTCIGSKTGIEILDCIVGLISL